MKNNGIFANILFWTTLVSPMIAFAVTSKVGETEIFGIAGIIRYSWTMWLFAPIGILSLLIGLKQNKKKNIVIAWICLFLFLIFGSYRFIFTTFTYDDNKVVEVTQSTNINLPTNIKIASINNPTYTVSHIKIVDEEEKTWFETGLKTNHLWQTQLGSTIKTLLPIEIQYQLTNFDYFMFFNLTTNEYNAYPSDGEYECVFIAYDCQNQHLVVVDNYTIILN